MAHKSPNSASRQGSIISFIGRLELRNETFESDACLETESVFLWDNHILI